MKPGSLVICIYDVIPNDVQSFYGAKPVYKDHVDYVRDIYKGETGVLVSLEGIKNPINHRYQIEYGYPVDAFRELEPPIKNILEHIDQNTGVRELEKLPTLEPVLV